MTITFPHAHDPMIWRATGLIGTLCLLIGFVTLALIALALWTCWDSRRSIDDDDTARPPMKNVLITASSILVIVGASVLLLNSGLVRQTGYGVTKSESRGNAYPAMIGGSGFRVSYRHVPASTAIKAGYSSNYSDLDDADQARLRAAITQHFGIMPVNPRANVALSLGSSSPLADAERGTTYRAGNTLENCALDATVQRNSLGQITSLTASTMTCANGSAGTTLTAKG